MSEPREKEGNAEGESNDQDLDDNGRAWAKFSQSNVAPARPLRLNYSFSSVPFSFFFFYQFLPNYTVQQCLATKLTVILQYT